MSIESKIEALTDAVNRIATVLERATFSVNSQPPAPIAPLANIVAAPVAAEVPMPVAAIPATLVAAPVAMPQVPAPVAAAEVQMPAPPSFFTPPVDIAAAPAAPAAPFSDGKGLVDYVMTKYKALGPEKGARIQEVLGTLGYGNINDVKPEHYGALFAGIEALG